MDIVEGSVLCFNIDEFQTAEQQKDTDVDVSSPDAEMDAYDTNDEEYDSDTDSVIDYPIDRSPSPEVDSASGLEEEATYTVSSEEVGFNGETRYEVRWSQSQSGCRSPNNSWQRNWVPGSAAFDAEQQAKRDDLAVVSPDIEIFGSSDIILERTFLRSQAYYEKRKLHPLDQTLNAQLKALDATSSKRLDEPGSHSTNAPSGSLTNAVKRKRNTSRFSLANPLSSNASDNEDAQTASRQRLEPHED